jgi:hypothetical protein
MFTSVYGDDGVVSVGMLVNVADECPTPIVTAGDEPGGTLSADGIDSSPDPSTNVKL